MGDFSIFSKSLLSSASSTKKPITTTSDNSSGSSGSSASAKKERTLTINGETHSLVISEDGTVYDYNETDETWTTRNGDQTLIYTDTDGDSDVDSENIDLNEIDVENLTIVSGGSYTSSTLGDNSTITDYTIVSSTQGTVVDTNGNNNGSDSPIVIVDDGTNSDPIDDGGYTPPTDTDGVSDDGNTDSSDDPGETGEEPSTPTPTPTTGSDDQYVVAIIDDFSTGLLVDDTSDSAVGETNIGLTHGDLVSAIITSGNDDDTNTANDVSVIEYNAYDSEDGGLSYEKILEYLSTIEDAVKSGQDIDAINMSIGVPMLPGDVGLSDINNLTEQERQSALQALEDSGYGDLVSIINKISDLSDLGVEIYISSGNDANDNYYDSKKTDSKNIFLNSGSSRVMSTKGDGTYEYYSSFGADKNNDNKLTEDEIYNLYKDYGYDLNSDGKISTYEQYKDYDENEDGIVTGRELGVFNALTLAKGSNVNVIGSTDSVNDTNQTDGVAEYSNYNDLVDELTEGDVEISFVSYNGTTGEYGYDIDSDGQADIWTKGGAEFTDDNQGYEIDNDGDGKYDDGYGYDLNGDGNIDIYSTEYYDSLAEIEAIYRDTFLATGTSFASPLAAKLKFGQA